MTFAGPRQLEEERLAREEERLAGFVEAEAREGRYWTHVARAEEMEERYERQEGGEEDRDEAQRERVMRGLRAAGVL